MRLEFSTLIAGRRVKMLMDAQASAQVVHRSQLDVTKFVP